MAIIGSWVNTLDLIESVNTKFNTEWPIEEFLENVYYVLDSFHIIRKYDPVIEYDSDIQEEFFNISKLQYFISVADYDIEDDDYFGGEPRLLRTDDSNEVYRYMFNAYAYKSEEERIDRESIIEKYIMIEDINKNISIGNLWEEAYDKFLINLKVVMEKRLEKKENTTYNLIFSGDN